MPTKAGPPHTATGHFRIRHDTVTTTAVTVVSKNHHHVLSSHHIDLTATTGATKQKNPGRWPGNL
jgi:hypothetical protein